MSREQQIDEMAKLICAYPQCIHHNIIGECANTDCLTVDIAENLYNAGYRKADDLIAENEQLRERHAAYDRQIRAEAITDFAESLKKYYFDTTQGSSPCCLVAYHIDQILKDKLKKLEGEG